MRPTALLRPALAIVALGIAATHGARAADAASFAAYIGVVGYPTIQSAVDAALPGETVRVAAGEWFEEVSVALDGPADVLTIDATDAVIDGGDATAVSVTGSGEVRIIGGTFRSSSTALLASGRDDRPLDVSVDGATIRSEGFGLVIQGASADIRLVDATARVGDAVLVRDCLRVVATGHISGAGRSGFVADRVDDLTLYDLHVERCVADGIRLRAGSAMVRGCSANDVGGNGFDVRVSRSCLVDNSATVRTASNGISLAWSPGAEVLVRSNRVDACLDGIVARGGNGTIGNNVVLGARRDGIVWRGNLSRGHFDGRQLGLEGNTIIQPARFAIRLGGSGHRLLANHIELADAGGRALTGRSRIVQLRANTVNGQKLR